MSYLATGDHPLTLASGRPVAPGETVPVAAVDPDDAHDQRLIDEGVLVELKPARKGAPTSKEKSK